MAILFRPLAGILTALAFTLVSIGPLSPATAASGYRYWGYYHADSGAGEWTLAKTGPSEYVPKDGSVEGWRFAISVGTKGREPRVAPGFADICAGTTAEKGEKRVAVVLDYGLADESPDGDTPPKPRGDCAVVADDASGTQVLQAVADVREEKGLTCGIDGYPSTECAAALKDVTVPAKDKPVDLALPRSATDKVAEPQASESRASESPVDEGSFPWGPVGAGALVLAIGAAAWFTVRQRA
jgi:hypothetical protein